MPLDLVDDSEATHCFFGWSISSRIAVVRALKPLFGVAFFGGSRWLTNFCAIHDQINTLFRSHRYRFSKASDRHAGNAFDLGCDVTKDLVAA